MSRFRPRSRYGLINGPQSGAGLDRSKQKVAPGNRVRRQGAFPEEGGRTLSKDEDQSTFGRQANSGAARLARAAAAQKRLGGGDGSSDREGLSEEEEEEGEEEEEDDDEEEEELLSDDIDGDTSKDRRQAEKRRIATETKAEAARVVENGRKKLEEEARKAVEAAELRKKRLSETIVIQDTDEEGESSEDKVRTPRKKKPRPRSSTTKKEANDELSEYTDAQLAKILASRRRSKSSPAPSSKKSATRPLFDDSDSQREDTGNDSDALPNLSCSSGKYITSSAGPKALSKVPKEKAPVASGSGSKNTKVVQVGKQKFDEKNYDRAAPMNAPPSVYKRARSNSDTTFDEIDPSSDSDSEDGASKKKVKAKKQKREFEIVEPDSDESARDAYEDELGEFDKIDKRMKKQKSDYRKERKPGYSNPRRN